MVDVSIHFPTYCPVGREVNCYSLSQPAVRFLIHPARLGQYYHLHRLRYLSKGICKKITVMALSKLENINVPWFIRRKQMIRV